MKGSREYNKNEGHPEPLYRMNHHSPDANAINAHNGYTMDAIPSISAGSTDCNHSMHGGRPKKENTLMMTRQGRG